MTLTAILGKLDHRTGAPIQESLEGPAKLAALQDLRVSGDEIWLQLRSPAELAELPAGRVASIGYALSPAQCGAATVQVVVGHKEVGKPGDFYYRQEAVVREVPTAKPFRCPLDVAMFILSTFPLNLAFEEVGAPPEDGDEPQPKPQPKRR